MSDGKKRDPRVDPRSGDTIRMTRVARVVGISTDGKFVYLQCMMPDGRGPYNQQSTHIDNWRKWREFSEVVDPPEGMPDDPMEENHE